MLPVWCKPHSLLGRSGTLLLLTLRPGARKSAVLGLYGDRLRIAIQAPPVDGAANEALIAQLALWAGVPRSSIHLISGIASRQKSVWIEGLAPELIASRLTP